MRSFTYERPTGLRTALTMGQGPNTAYLGGGTTLIDLMKLDVMRPARLVDITGLRDHGRPAVELDGQGGLRLDAFARMAEIADDPRIQAACPMITQSLQLGASQQLRNMARLGGNVLQRTRCSYFRDPSFTACNKRAPGSGCAARSGIDRHHAVLGTSDACIAIYPGDFGQALAALDASVELMGAGGVRMLPFADLIRLPGDRPDVENALAPGELILGFRIALQPWMRRSLYLKIRDRQSYAFALASAAVALDLDGDVVRQARIAMGGVATIPWRATAAEAALAGQRLDEAGAARAADSAFADARAGRHNAYKIALGKQTLTRALIDAGRIATA